MDLSMTVAALSQPLAAVADGRFWEARPPHAVPMPRSSRRLAAGTAAASLLVHGGLLLAIALLDPHFNFPGPASEIQVELVTEPAMPEKSHVVPGARQISPAPREAMQNEPGGTDATLQQKTRIDQESKLGEKPPTSRSSRAKPASTPAAANRASGVTGTAPHKDIAGEKTAREKNHLAAGGSLAPHFDSEPDRYRAAAVPLPVERGGEAMSYRLIVGGMLERAKQYPERALHHAKGIATVGFVLDHSGGVASVVLLRSSGEADLDAESLALVNRAAPFPPPPAGAPKSFAIEVAFGMGH
jgi:protein TonB